MNPALHANALGRSGRIDRRHFMALFSALGLGGTLLPEALWARLQQAPRITRDMLDEAESLAGLSFTDPERELVLKSVNEQLAFYEKLRSVRIPNDVPPALRFDPVLPGMELPTVRKALRVSRPARVARPQNLEEVAFWPVTRLAELIRTRQVTSEELTRMYLGRLERYGPKLECVVTLTTERALEEARRADAELAQGRYRGPLHGIPWGGKDLLAAAGYRTTWGAKPFESQVIREDATVVQRLGEAGAVLVAKLTLGELATGDVWFGGRTRNPWNLEQGSSGSSAGSAAATAAGLVGFSIGSETRGSIVSPSTRCGVTGLRPTFGRVSRHGAMALVWSMDKLGPLGRSVEDCALVLHAIQGPDGKDPFVRDVPFNWDPDVRPSDLRVGYLRAAFEEDHDTKEFDLRALDVLKSMGVELVPVDLPGDYPVDALVLILYAESAAAFDELTRNNQDDLLARQDENAWPNRFRRARFIPAVEYIQANRIRTMVMGALDGALQGIDVLVAPTFQRDIVLLTNLTGHPAVCVPNGFRETDGTPVSLCFFGQLFGEAATLALAKAYQDATGFHERRPPMFG